ncbi:MAG: hypothetical protein IJF28_06620, partial [Firmicutes bacterium]|nr:hypothetical protein [Bacillota bacterium]
NQSLPAQETAKEQSTTTQECADNRSLPAQEATLEPALSMQEPDTEAGPESVLDSDDEYVPSHDANLF